MNSWDEHSENSVFRSADAEDTTLCDFHSSEDVTDISVQGIPLVA